ncbi:helix-turn-helix transcriptional regulator [Paenibacillus ihuae]|uniref:helix-turn-helix transcriptional regulator n=1 Tax=Paenibacillus ihuae TaxID=1232431 RepID=UPI0006D5481B|nr:YafY family protein [Paenibacillus ihuae]
MKINRLLGIVVYLLNREVVSARTLAEKYEVSPRTIQRDMESIGLAGIPIGSIQGVNGGYYILDSFKMNRQLLQPEDYKYIVAALRGLVSGYNSRRAEETVEKMLSLSPEGSEAVQPLQLDLEVLREGSGTVQYIEVIEEAIRQKCTVRFQYTNARQTVSSRSVEPLLLSYKWYAWYLFAYCRDRRDYRLFRLSRIREIQNTGEAYTQDHGNAARLLADHQDRRANITVKLACPADRRVQLEEAFPKARLLEERCTELVMEFTVPEEESGWFATLLLLGGQCTVLEPESLRLRLQSHARMIVQKYEGNDDRQLSGLPVYNGDIHTIRRA